MLNEARELALVLAMIRERAGERLTGGSQGRGRAD